MYCLRGDARDGEEMSVSYDDLIALLDAGRHDDLERAARDLTVAAPSDAGAWQMLGVSLLARRRDAEAVPALLQSSRLQPRNPSVWDNLGLALSRLGRASDAETCFGNALGMQPKLLAAWVNRSSNALQAGDPGLAERCAREALALNRDTAAAHLNLGNALATLGQAGQAEMPLREALRLAPHWPEAELSLAAVLETTGRLQEGVACLDGLLSRHPEDWRAHTNRASLLSRLGMTRAAREGYARALALNPAAYDAFSGMLFLSLHSDEVDPRALFDAHVRFGERVEASFRERVRAFGNSRDPDRRLQVGFVSGDLRRHAVAHFFEPMLRALVAHPGLEVTLYSNHPCEDEVTVRFRALAPRWRKVIGLPDDGLEGLIRGDGIDILIDLSGHTAFNRLPVFARKPAPIQVSWLGYPATTGMRTMDYRPVYGPANPPGLLDGQFTEKLVYLDCPTMFGMDQDLPDCVPPPVLGNGFVTFGNFNRPSKVSERAVALWSRVLHRVQDARMLFAGVDDESTAAALRARFARYGISAERIVTRPYLPMQDYLRLHGEIDVMLDGFPYAGGTTTHHALRMGVPVVTLAGPMLQQRAGAGILQAEDLADWIVEDEDAYVERARRAAIEIDTLRRLRAELRARIEGNPRRRPEFFAHGLERALRTMWRRWCDGLPAVSFVQESSDE